MNTCLPFVRSCWQANLLRYAIHERAVAAPGQGRAVRDGGRGGAPAGAGTGGMEGLALGGEA